MLVNGLAVAGAPGAGMVAGDVQAIRDCVAANGPRHTLIQTLKIESFERADGSGRRITAKLFYRHLGADETRTTLQVRAPGALAGTSYLLVDTLAGDRLFLYLPGLDRTRLVTGGGAASSILGTDFSYADIMFVHAITSQGDVRRLPDRELAGRSTHTLELTPPASADSAYRRVLFRIDQKTCVPLRIVYFGADEQPIKRYAADPESLVQINGHWLAAKATMRNLLEQSHTTLWIESAVFDSEVPDSVFHRRTFHLGAARRLVPVHRRWV